MDETDFKEEQNKYNYLWNTDYKESRYMKLINYMLNFLKRENYLEYSFIDFGCGNCKVLEYLTKKNIFKRKNGIDISSSIINSNNKNYTLNVSSIDNTKFKNDEFIIGFSSDVLEHIEEKYIDNSLKEMSRVCSKYLFLSISPKKAKHINPLNKNENLHLTVKPKEWWEKKLSNYGTVKRLEPFYQRPFNTSLRYCIILK
jgi:ubiquinone/menaquinone biosynthesis C-methylase UbiE